MDALPRCAAVIASRGMWTTLGGTFSPVSPRADDAEGPGADLASAEHPDQCQVGDRPDGAAVVVPLAREGRAKHSARGPGPV